MDDAKLPSTFGAENGVNSGKMVQNPVNGYELP